MTSAADLLPDVIDCRAARRRIADEVIRTPVRRLDWLSGIVGREVWAKLELQQVTGSFKFRGALNALRRLAAGATVITASAGNHALALAHAARLTGHRLTVFLPHTASPIKRERLVEAGVSLVDWGETLEDAVAEARAVCARSGAAWISPYSDGSVIAGQAGVVYELLEQVPAMDALVVPIGGGGLVTAALLAAADVRPELRVVGCQPERYPSFQLAYHARAQRLPFRYTLADGLLVQVDDTSLTVVACRGRLERVCLLDEEHVAAAVYALLHHESLMVEGAGAAGVAAGLAGALADLPGSGPIGVLLTGGNITSMALATALTYPFSSEALRRHLGLQGRTTAEIRWAPGAGRALAQPESSEALEDTADLVGARLGGLRQHAAASLESRRRLEAFCASEGLDLVDEERAALDAVARELGRIVASCERAAGELDEADVAGFVRRERLERLGYQMSAFLSTAASWQSPTYAQSLIAGFTRTSSQRSSSVNYSRYHSSVVVECERRMLEALGLDGERASLMLCSSGMVAYSLLESYLARDVVHPGDRVLLPPYIYFESEEQLAGLPAVEIVRLGDTRADTIVEFVRQHRPRVLFLDPLANIAGLPLTSVGAVLLALARAETGPLHVVIDGTMLSGAFDPFAFVPPDSEITVLYYESASKYLQLGLDLTLAGLIAVPVSLRPRFARLRRNTGAILYEEGAARLPRYDRATFLARMRRMTRNALLIAGVIEQFAGRVVTPVFPGLSSHPDHDLCSEYAHLGGVMTFDFRDSGFNGQDLLNAFIERAIIAAQRNRVPLTRGVSFGFSAPRISAASAMAEGQPPFLRLSVGDLPDEPTLALAHTLAGVFVAFANDVDDLRRGDLEAEPRPRRTTSAEHADHRGT
ncbi:pyridoxal-phosphate dependent enzyme [Sorangium sp. So ce1014]|uniref:pyridoxal-phosphate dependent enzyme n=1 Tax=Sorangium sp. So ce1014 TaxID=3133326 RepID=UPI003F5FB581